MWQSIQMIDSNIGVLVGRYLDLMEFRVSIKLALEAAQGKGVGDQYHG